MTNLVGAIAKGSNSVALLQRLETTELKLSELRREWEAIAAAAYLPPIEVGHVLQARSEIKDALRAGDTEQMRSLLAAICSAVHVDWSQRRDLILNFNYRYEDMRKPLRVELSPSEEAEIRADIAALEAQGKFTPPIPVPGQTLSDADLANEAMPYRVHITVKGAPLTFVPNWSITNAERAA